MLNSPKTPNFSIFLPFHYKSRGKSREAGSGGQDCSLFGDPLNS